MDGVVDSIEAIDVVRAVAGIELSETFILKSIVSILVPILLAFSCNAQHDCNIEFGLQLTFSTDIVTFTGFLLVITRFRLRKYMQFSLSPLLPPYGTDQT